MQEFFKLTSKQVLESLGTTENGLRKDDIHKRREEQGFNELAEQKRKSTFQVFIEQFKDFLVLILIAAAIITAFLGKLESTIVIMVVIIINAILGTAQHKKAEQSLNSLKALSSPTAKVLRNGQKVEIPSRELLVGDILYLDAGDYISADGRILETFSLQVDESSLTGESISVLKTSDKIDGDHIAIGDRKNMVFSGSFVTYGRAVVVITAIGMNTEIGKIANLLESAKEKKTPLQANLDAFGKKLAIFVLAISALVFSINLFRGHPIAESFMFAVSLAVAAIPEALSSIVTIVLALGTQKMAKQNAIVRKLHAVESLGSISVICSDKTGTLTQNKMTVKKLYVNDNIIDDNHLDINNKTEKKLIQMALLCNDAITVKDKEIGDPTEIALVNLGEIYGLDEERMREDIPRISEIPFDSDRKLMSTVHKLDGKTVMITKGALDVMLGRISHIQKENEITAFTKADKQTIEKINYELSTNGLRILAFSYKEIQKNDIDLKDEDNLIFIGLIAMMDPPRVESAQAVESCIQAGIKPVMITGDHKVTAAAIAKEIGILQNENEAMEGYLLDSLSDEQLKEKVEQISVYARVSPEHKIRIVRAWQELGNVVAMTGDGVNDAPALKQADIGIAMGITGTEVAKDAASMVLTDDNFSTIVKAISNGRSIYENIKNSIKFLLAGNTGGILAVLYATLASLPVPFAPVHLLFINLLTDSLPAIAIGLEPHNERIMKDKPRKRNTPILNKQFGIEVLIEGIIIAISTMAAFHIGLETGNKVIASTMAFATLSISRLFHGFNSRSKESIFKVGVFTNKPLWFSIIIGNLLLLFVLNFNPLSKVFEVEALTGMQYLAIYGLSLVPLVLVQLYKLIFVRDR
ncbi:cation-translocating P-type ATPase [Mobilitalea sibirica]|uniref:Cation-translocating P-type ATPase n=1 Tax=Mobilitalea sibirica TaxID=1462919 RepID=A0A8J7KSG2_9FIRM|nr:cation-translocating P-type ATPase [Mobilitalea sibirica]MBH1940266.1 cation-translocating P-type ATPase [Mobilitalea sibirica]